MWRSCSSARDPTKRPAPGWRSPCDEGASLTSARSPAALPAGAPAGSRSSRWSLRGKPRGMSDRIFRRITGVAPGRYRVVVHMRDAFGAAGDAPEPSVSPGGGRGLARGPAGEMAGSAPHRDTDAIRDTAGAAGAAACGSEYQDLAERGSRMHQWGASEHQDREGRLVVNRGTSGRSPDPDTLANGE